MKLKNQRVEFISLNSNKSQRKPKIKKYFRDRYKYFLIGYFLIYVIWITHLLPSYKEWTYQTIFPIKIFYFCLSLLFGNLFYYIVEEADWIRERGHYAAIFRTMKYVIIVILIMFIFSKTQQYLLMYYNLDVEWLMGI